MRHIVVVVALVLGAFGSAFAQEIPDSSKMGLVVGFAPWETETRLISTLAPSVDDFNLHGKEFRVGLIVRGREQGGDWGVSLVRKGISSSSTVTVDKGNNCLGATRDAVCYQDNDWYSMRSGTMTGVEVHKFIPFVNIKRRAQIGMNLGGGAAWISGQSDKTSLRHPFVFDAARNQYVVTPVKTTSTVEIQELLEEEGAPNMLPLIRLEAAAAFIIPGGAKLRFGGGFNFPGYEKFSVSLIYLIGK